MKRLTTLALACSLGATATTATASGPNAAKAINPNVEALLQAQGIDPSEILGLFEETFLSPGG